jgi:hypothetical protein
LGNPSPSSSYPYRNPAEEKPISLQEDGSINPPSSKLAQVRAAKASYGTNSDQDMTAAGIASGREPIVRQQAAYGADLDWQAQRNNLIKNIVTENQGKVSPEQLALSYRR